MYRVVALALLWACSPRLVDGEATSLTAEQATLEFVPQWRAPAGADGAPRFLVRLKHGKHSAAVDTGGPVTHAVLFGEQVVSVDRAGRMRIGAQVVAEDVYGQPVVAKERLAYVVVRESGCADRGPIQMGRERSEALSGRGTQRIHSVGGGGCNPAPSEMTVWSEVHVRDATVDRVIDRSLYQVGALRFSPDGAALVGIGARDGGVAGLHVFDVVQPSHRCLTHCDLIAGRPLGEDYQPPTSNFAFDHDRLVWRGGSVRWR